RTMGHVPPRRTRRVRTVLSRRPLRARRSGERARRQRLHHRRRVETVPVHGGEGRVPLRRPPPGKGGQRGVLLLLLRLLLMKWRPLAAATYLVATLLPSALGAAHLRLKVITHPTRATKLTIAQLRAIYLKQNVLWDDGRTIIPINREAGSEAREQFSQRI